MNGLIIPGQPEPRPEPEEGLLFAGLLVPGAHQFRMPGRPGEWLDLEETTTQGETTVILRTSTGREFLTSAMVQWPARLTPAALEVVGG